jgi:uncharacterized protein (DUF1697 family)
VHGLRDVSTYIPSGNALSGAAEADRAPDRFGAEPKRFRYDVAFLKEPLTAAAALAQVRTKEGVDLVWAGEGAPYFSRLIERAAQSHLSRLTAMPISGSMTVRNWNTTTRLRGLLRDAA